MRKLADLEIALDGDGRIDQPLFFAQLDGETLGCFHRAGDPALQTARMSGVGVGLESGATQLSHAITVGTP